MTHFITHALVFAAACIFTTAAIFLFFYFKEIKTPFHIRRTSDGKLVMYVSMRYNGITYNNVILKMTNFTVSASTLLSIHTLALVKNPMFIFSMTVNILA